MGGFTAKQQKEKKAQRTAIKSLGTREEKMAALRKNPGLLTAPHPDSTKRPERKLVDGKQVRSKTYGTMGRRNVLGPDERWETRPEVLLRARSTYESNTGRKARPVETSLAYKDFTAAEKKEYKKLINAGMDYRLAKKSLLGGG